MSVLDARIKIGQIRHKLLVIQGLIPINGSNIYTDSDDPPDLLPNEEMSEICPEQNAELHLEWEEIQKLVPPGFAIDGNLVRHLSFNQAQDWVDIANNDIPRELIKIEEYKKQLVLIEYLDSLHPEISRVSEIVLNGDIDAALKTVFSSLDSKVRSYLKVRPSESTVPAIGKAFKDGILAAPYEENNDNARNYLQGVLGYYRSNILHNPLPSSRNRLDTSLSLFGIAHEAFHLFDICSTRRKL